MLTVTGELLVSYHGSVVTDPTCNRGIAVEWFEEDVPRMRAFDAAAERLRNSESESLTVRATGTMKRAPARDLTPEPYWYLRLSSAQVLSERKRR
jgi:hypothetical protein